MNKLKQLTDKQCEFIKVYRKHGGNIQKVCNELNITTAGVNKYLQNEKVKEQLSRSIQIARESIEVATPYLINKAMEMINSDEVSEKVKAQLLNSLLDRSGLVTPKQPSVSININTEISDRARTLLAQTLQKDQTLQIESEQ